MDLTAETILRNPDFNRATTIFEFRVKDLYGKIVNLDVYTGNTCMFVNVASRSIFTDYWYKQLSKLHDAYVDKGLRILAFPCNQFDGGEPGAAQDILRFHQERRVQFHVFDKVDVNSQSAAPVWKFLKYKLPLENNKGSVITSNFHIFIVGKNGLPQQRFGPDVEKKKLVQAIEVEHGQDLVKTIITSMNPKVKRK